MPNCNNSGSACIAIIIIIIVIIIIFMICYSVSNNNCQNNKNNKNNFCDGSCCGQYGWHKANNGKTMHGNSVCYSCDDFYWASCEGPNILGPYQY